MSSVPTFISGAFYRSPLLRQLRQLLFERPPGTSWKAIQWMMLGLLRKEVTLHTAQGQFAVSTRDTAIGRELFIHRGFESDLLSLVQDILHTSGTLPPGPVDLLLDVGANIGTTCIGAIRSGLASRSIAVEPEPSNFSLLTKNVASNDLQEKIICIQAALSDQTGQASLELSQTNLGDHRIRSISVPEGGNAFSEHTRRTIAVPTLTLDALVSSQPAAFHQCSTLLWMDVQGHEKKVFDGAPHLLTRGIPTVTEYWPYGMKRAGLDMADLHSTFTRYWSRVVDLNAPSVGPLPISQWQNLCAHLSRVGDYTNLLLLPA